MLEIPPKDYEFVQKIAYKYFMRSNYFIELDDLIQEGMLAYIKCSEKYVEEKNNFFMGYAYLRVSGAIKDYIGKNSPKGGATVRPNSAKSKREVYTFSSIGLDENSFEDTTSSSIEEELVRLQCKEEFERYMKTLTPTEQVILYEYFIIQLSIVKLSDEYKISRVKVKQIIKSCLEHMKKFFHIEDTLD